jgi:hypothetical protein
MLVMVFTSLLLLGACNLIGAGDGGSSENNKPQTNIQLLRIETSDHSMGGGAFDAVIKHTSKKIVAQAESTTPVFSVEEIDNSYISLVAVIKNEDRASFIDMVVYNSQTDKIVVYNEGNGSYQCRSETVYEDGMWVTNIGFSVQAELTSEDFFFEIQEIKFLRNNTDEKADLNTVDVRRKDFRFSTAYFDERATSALKQNIEGMECLEDRWVQIDHVNKTVEIGGIYYVDDGNTIKDDVYGTVIKEVSIIVPQTVVLQYYENRELKSGEFTVSALRLKDINTRSWHSDYIATLEINFSIKVDTHVKVGNLIYAEGMEICETSMGIHPVYGVYIPSTCEEIVWESDIYPDGITIHYNGTIADFRNIKGANEWISLMDTAEKFFQIVCTDGTTTFNDRI